MSGKKLTRRAVLIECYGMFEATARRFGTNYTLLEAKDGYEMPFDREKQKMEIIREMIREEDAKDAAAAHA